MNPRILTHRFPRFAVAIVLLALISQATQALGADCEPLFQSPDATTEAVLDWSRTRERPRLNLKALLNVRKLLATKKTTLAEIIDRTRDFRITEATALIEDIQKPESALFSNRHTGPAPAYWTPRNHATGHLLDPRAAHLRIIVLCADPARRCDPSTEKDPDASDNLIATITYWHDPNDPHPVLTIDTVNVAPDFQGFAINSFLLTEIVGALNPKPLRIGTDYLDQTNAQIFYRHLLAGLALDPGWLSVDMSAVPLELAGLSEDALYNIFMNCCRKAFFGDEIFIGTQPGGPLVPASDSPEAVRYLHDALLATVAGKTRAKAGYPFICEESIFWKWVSAQQKFRITFAACPK